MVAGVTILPCDKEIYWSLFEIPVLVAHYSYSHHFSSIPPFSDLGPQLHNGERSESLIKWNLGQSDKSKIVRKKVRDLSLEG